MIKMENKLTKRFVDTRGEQVITKKQFMWKEINDNNFIGDISLLNMIETKNKWEMVREDGKEVCILDSGYKWLGVYPKDETYAITGLYDKDNKLVEFYFDMTKENGRENNKPYIVDIYLDLVITPDNMKIVLDEDELEDALNQNILGKEEYNLAYETLEKLQNKYSTNEDIEKLKNIFDRYLVDMLDKIKDEEIICKEDTV